MIKKQHRRRILLISFISTCSFLACAQAKSSDQLKPLNMHSQSVKYNLQTNTVTYIGNVHAYQGTTYLSGDKVIVKRNPLNQIVKLTDYGNPAHYSTIPDHQHTRLYAQAKKIVYDPIHKIVILFHHGYVKQNGSEMTAPLIQYHMLTGVIKTWPTDKQAKTTIIVQPSNTIK